MSEKPKTPAEEDEALLREAEARVKEVLALLGDKDRPGADQALEGARGEREKHRGSAEKIFHRPAGSGKSLVLSKENHSLLGLAEALKRRVKLGQYALDLQVSLGTYLEQSVQVLERQLKRARY